MGREYDTRFVFRTRTQKITEVFANSKTKEVWFENFISDPIQLVFGIRKIATWEDLIDFFESRCFEQGRGDIKDILRFHGLSYYNPFEIVKYYNGRAAEDNCYIDFLRWEGNYECEDYYESR